MSGSTISKRRRPRRLIVDVYRSDFIQDSGTPLQWAIAWEAVGERERALAAVEFTAAMMMASGIPFTAAGLLRLAATLVERTDA
ncbi:MAG TPA: hypothetical protein VE932_04940 [Patescibacteria group bacterium]|nr:hypothetical protein [Patescibacteria group bacterium]